jgi:hypothetical protein
MKNMQSQKLGSGIIIISFIHFIGAIFSILGAILLLSRKDVVINQLQATKQSIPLTLSTTQITISLILQLIMIITIILILFKKSIGVYSYFTIVAINIIHTIMGNGFKWTIICSLILPILMTIFINKKKELFNF